MKKLLALTIVLVLILSMGSAAFAEKKYGFEGYPDGITLTMFKPMDEQLMNIAETTTPISGETIEKNRFTDLWLEELGITLEYEWIAVGDEAKQKRAMQIASGDLPDLLWVDRSSLMLKDLAENDVIWDMTELYDQYASDLLKSLLSYNGSTAALESVSVGGKLYAIPNILPSYDQCQYMWIRQDWLDNLGLEVPTNYEELFEVCKAFTENDPDGNGENDTWGYYAELAVNGYQSAGYYWGHHAYPKAWIEMEDGTVGYGSVQPEMLNALKGMREIIEAGYVYPEWATSGSGEQLINGKIGITFSQASMPVAYSAFYSNVPETAYWKAYPMISCDDESAISMVGVEAFGLLNAIAVNKECEHPEAIIMMFNVLVEAMWGENNNYEYYYAGDAPSGNYYNISDVVHLANDFNIKAYKQIWEAVENGTTDSLTGAAATYYKNMMESNRGWEDYISNEHSGNKILVELYDPQNLIAYSAYQGAPTETMSDRQTMLDDLENDMFAQILLGEVEAEEGFNSFVEQWNELGGAKITEEVNVALGK